MCENVGGDFYVFTSECISLYLTGYGHYLRDSSEDVHHSFIFSFFSPQVLILHSYLADTPVVCSWQTKNRKKPLQSSHLQYTFAALLISFKIVFAENGKNVDFNISHSLQHLDWCC